MRAATRYGLVGIAALALLTAAHRLRERGGTDNPVAEALLGVLPNFAAAIAIAFVLLGFWSDQRPGADGRASWRAFGVCASISGAGLIAWEAIQRGSRTLVFDPGDIWATMLGVVASALLFRLIAPRAERRG
jgi:hypothetical protein